MPSSMKRYMHMLMPPVEVSQGVRREAREAVSLFLDVAEWHIQLDGAQSRLPDGGEVAHVWNCISLIMF